jgi:hypothetical protein
MKGEFSGKLPFDLERYLGLCQRGELYDFLIWKSGWKGTRSEWKGRVWFRFLYGKPIGPNWEPGPRFLASRKQDGLTDQEIQQAVVGIKTLAAAFRQEFPSVNRWINGKKKGDKGGLARAMQKLESKIVIGGVVGELARVRPDVPFLTIHDALLVLPEHAGYVSWLLMREYGRLGVTPKVNIEQAEELRIAA